MRIVIIIYFFYLDNVRNAKPYFPEAAQWQGCLGPALLLRVWRFNQSQSFARNFKHFQISVPLPKWDGSAKFVNKIVPFLYMQVKFNADNQIEL